MGYITVNLACTDQNVLDITVLEINPQTGVCDFTGGVFFFPGKKETEDPIPLIDIVVKKTPPGNAVAIATTDENGLFTFLNMEVGQSYTFYLNVPGMPMIENYSIVVSPGDVLYPDLNFYLDTISGPDAGVYTTIPPNGIQDFESKVEIYPNPNNGAFTLVLENEFTLGLVSFEIMNVTGQLIQSEVITISGNYLKKQVELNVAKGVYTVRLTTNGNVYSEKLIIK